MFNILIIDSNIPFRQSLRNVLTNRLAFVKVAEAFDGTEGLRKILSHQPHLIFIDLHLPDENGLEVARRIKTGNPKTVIVILTNDDLPEYQNAIIDAGFEHLVPKDDWTGADFIALVERIITDLIPDPQGGEAQNQTIR